MTVLGKKYKCIITGFEGVAVGRVEYITGCNQALLAPGVGADGASRESAWIDEQRLNELPGDAIKLNNSDSKGFDKAAPKR
jgi:hypothetical protein